MLSGKFFHRFRCFVGPRTTVPVTSLTSRCLHPVRSTRRISANKRREHGDPERLPRSQPHLNVHSSTDRHIRLRYKSAPSQHTARSAWREVFSAGDGSSRDRWDQHGTPLTRRYRTPSVPTALARSAVRITVQNTSQQPVGASRDIHSCLFASAGVTRREMPDLKGIIFIGDSPVHIIHELPRPSP